MNREPSVFPVAPATVFPAESKPGVPDGLCDQRGAPMSTPSDNERADEIMIEHVDHWRARATQAEQERDAANAERRRTARKRNKVAADRDRLRTALEDAIECVASWGAYAEDYFKEKWDLEGDLARLRAALGSTTEPQQAALTMAVVEEAAYATAAVYVDGDGESAAWMVRDLIVLAGSTTEPEETRAALIEAGESLDLTGRVLDFEIVAEPEEAEK